MFGSQPVSGFLHAKDRVASYCCDLTLTSSSRCKACQKVMRNGRSVPLPADERSNKAADAEEAQSCRGLDDSCLSNIIVLHRWLVPARHNRLLHRSAAAPASLIHTHTRQAMPLLHGPRAMPFRQARDATCRTLSKRADEGTGQGCLAVARFKTLANFRDSTRNSAVLLTGNLSRVEFLPDHIGRLSKFAATLSFS